MSERTLAEKVAAPWWALPWLVTMGHFGKPLPKGVLVKAVRKAAPSFVNPLEVFAGLLPDGVRGLGVVVCFVTCVFSLGMVAGSWGWHERMAALEVRSASVVEPQPLVPPLTPHPDP